LLSIFSTPPVTTHIYLLSLHDALPISVTFGERVFKRHAFGDRPLDEDADHAFVEGPVAECDRPLDEDADHAFAAGPRNQTMRLRSEEHTSELQSRFDLVCRLLLEKKKK